MITSKKIAQNCHIYLCWTFWITLTICALFANTPDNFNLNYESKKTLTHLLPQGWGFFTKDPRENMVDAYEISNGKLELLTINNFSSSNFFGMSRENRRVGFEVSMILQNIKEKDWLELVGVNFYIPDSTYSVTVKKNNMFIFKPGREYVLHRYKSIPFAWANTDQVKYRPYSIIKFKVNRDD